jgi:hypothetical protein
VAVEELGWAIAPQDDEGAGGWPNLEVLKFS